MTVTMEILSPIIPFEPIKADQIPKGEQWIAQVKWDGIRLLTYYDGKQVRLFNRRLNERTVQYPELLNISSYCKESSVILDGEVIALDEEGKPSFHNVMRRDSIRIRKRVTSLQKRVPIFYMIFDVVLCQHQWINHLPLKKRLDILHRIIKPNQHIQIVPSYPDAESLFTAVKEQKMEGIVVKDLNSSYLINGKDERWQKIKNYQDLIAVVGGVTFRQQLVNALLLGLYDQEGQLWYIGHAGSGKLTFQDWIDLTEVVREIKTKKRPFINVPERRNEVVWVKPQLTVKIRFLEWTKTKTLRQPVIQSFVAADIEKCTFDQ